MKNVRFILAALALAGVMLVPALAAEGEMYATGADLLNSWYSDTSDWGSVYPDYVCGVWVEPGREDVLIIAVTDDEAGAAGREELLAQIRDKDSVSFTTRTYSYARLYQVQKELEGYMGEDNGIFSAGVYDMENKVVIGIDTSNENAAAAMEEIAARYGGMVRFESGEGVVLDVTVEADSDSAVAGNDLSRYVMPVCMVMAVLGGGALFVYLRGPKKTKD